MVCPMLNVTVRLGLRGRKKIIVPPRRIMNIIGRVATGPADLRLMGHPQINLASTCVQIRIHN